MKGCQFFLKEVCGADGAAVEDLHAVFTFGLLQNLYFGSGETCADEFYSVRFSDETQRHQRVLLEAAKTQCGRTVDFESMPL